MEQTFEEYLRQEIRYAPGGQMLDFHIRASVCIDGIVRFYIHPQHKDGRTADIKVNDNELIVLDIIGENI